MTSSLNLAIYESPPPSEAPERDEALVTLDEAQASLSLLGKGFSLKYLKSKPLDQAPRYLANTRRPFPFGNGREVYLPASLEVFDTRKDNWRVYRLFAAMQAWQWEAGTYDRPRAEEMEALCGKQRWMENKDPLGFVRFFLGRFPLPWLAGDIFITLETARVAWSMAREFRGLAEDLAWFLPRLRAFSEPPGYTALLWNLFFHLMAPRDSAPATAEIEPIAEAARGVAEPGAELKDSLRATITVYGILESLAKASCPSGKGMRLEGIDEFFKEIIPSLKGNKATRFGSGDEDEGEGVMVPPELAEALSLDFYSHLIPSGVGDFVFQDMLGKQIEDKAKSDVYSQAKEARKQAAEEAAENDENLEVCLLYPEWDYLAGGYLRNWTTLYQLKAKEGDEITAARLLRGWDDLVNEVCRQFRMLRYQERTWKKRLEWATDIDIEKAVEREVELKCGLPPSDKVYMEKRRVGREVSALFLLDLSASTSAEIEEGSHKGETVLQVLQASVAIMARALEQLGDRYGIYGFSGYGRKRVEFMRIKSFEENMGEAVWRRMAGLKPFKSTRMGAAVRHAHHLLNAEPSYLKLMLLLSDGYPQDFDYGEDRTDREFGLRDTAQSLREAEAGHIVPFCLTVDTAGHDYLRRMCPPHGYLVMKSVEKLPSELPKVYLRLRGN
ncbi:MAG: hypothetical protein SWK76_07600 [Actinomycetota bacterium]|nr:hypothetical protein [Actinomycetota bacterium]